MAEKVVSPGVFTNEIDQSFLPAAIGEIGAAIVGPTVKGPALVPTVVNSFSDYEQRFGTSFRSGSVGGAYYQYLTSHTAENYLKAGPNATVVRILDDDYSNAYGAVPSGSNNLDNSSNTFTASHHALPNQWAGEGFGDSGTYSFKLWTQADGAIMNSVSASANGFEYSGSWGGGISDLGKNNALASGSVHNLRWEISTVNANKGTFTLLVRRGDDTIKRKQILETWNNLTLDPNSSNYIAKVIGDTRNVLAGTTSEPYIQPSGSYPNKSKYVYVEVFKQTPDYLDSNGDVRITGSNQSLPGLNSGSFTGGSNGYAGFDALGNFGGSAPVGNYQFYENISTETQGYIPNTADAATGYNAYVKALNLLKNQDEYDFNLLLLPGILSDVHGKIVTKAIDICEDRGDCFVVVDPVVFNSALTSAKTQAESYDSSYSAMYWPWIQVPDNSTGTPRWVPPSVVIPGVYAFNDTVAHPWFAPAGLNRGGIDTAIQAERKLTHSNRDDLYEANMNPIATFPGQGVTVWGQKTLQKKSSALDRINVRRLMIKLKKFIASSSRFLVFEQNNQTTRAKFLNIVNPFLEQVQSQS